jgi:capsular polysaccharide transport system permease protein
MIAKARKFRPPLTVTLAVWKALFLREALFRMTQYRLAWMWLIVEPISHILLLKWVFTMFRQRLTPGADTLVFIIVGVMCFFMPRNMMMRAMEGIDSNESLYAFRQVKPVDTVIVRAMLEGVLEGIIFLVIFTGAGLLGAPVRPADPLGALQALGALWLTGLGLGLIFSVLGNLVPEFGRLLRLFVSPVYIISGVMFPLALLPPALRDAALMNPLVHGIESARLAFMPAYLMPPGIDLAYLVQFAVVMIFIGLLLQVRYRADLVGR